MVFPIARLLGFRASTAIHRYEYGLRTAGGNRGGGGEVMKIASSVATSAVARVAGGGNGQPSAASLIAASTAAAPTSIVTKAHATPRAGGVEGSARVGGDFNGDSGGDQKKKGRGKNFWERVWNFYEKIVDLFNLLNRIRDAIGIVVGFGVSVYTIAFMKPIEKVVEEMMTFLRKFSKFIREDEDITDLTVSWTEIAAIPVQVEIIMKQLREIVNKLDKMKRKEEEVGDGDGVGKEGMDGKGEGKNDMDGEGEGK